MNPQELFECVGYGILGTYAIGATLVGVYITARKLSLEISDQEELEKVIREEAKKLHLNHVNISGTYHIDCGPHDGHYGPYANLNDDDGSWKVGVVKPARLCDVRHELFHIKRHERGLLRTTLKDGLLKYILYEDWHAELYGLFGIQI